MLGMFAKNLSKTLLVATCLAATVGCAGAASSGDREDAARVTEQRCQAPSWLLDVSDHGSWVDESRPDVVRGWVDVKVANVRYDKRVFIESAAPYADAWMRILHVASYRGPLDGGGERWGADTLEYYPDGGPNGASLTGPVVARAKFQVDQDGDGVDEMVVTPWQIVYGEGELRVPEDDPWAPGELSSPVNPDDDAKVEPLVLWSPYDDPGQEVVARIDRIIAAARANPGERHTLHAAVFNITDPQIVDKLIEAHRAGVEVRLLFDGRKARPWYHWYTGDDKLLSAGVPLLGVRRPNGGAMHDKIALFDGKAVATGSFNWETGARHENHELMLVTERAELLHAYARRFEAVAGGVLAPRAYANDVNGEVSVSFAPDEQPYRVVGKLLDNAKESINLAMFTAKDVEYDEDGHRTSLLRKLIAAHNRGVRVNVIIDYGIAESSEYHGVISEDDQTDEWLEAAGVHVVRADNQNGRYASMHHKFLTIDNQTAVLGAMNWYHTSAYDNDEDQLIWRSKRLAADLNAEVVDLLRRYDSSFDASQWPQTTLDFRVSCDGTSWGQTLRVVGDTAALGTWVPEDGLVLDGARWPRWTGTLTVPTGTRMELKLVIAGDAGFARWESGVNRRVRAFGDGAAMQVPMSFRW